ncbi:hypothetical protein KDD17_02380 [Sulfitobacter albidus]|uniref:Uncharacterized protein n=1 Tax=Sulfitobacter albidus TaxID=2829501 RepID=A0A975JEE8_9RHOB|nr:hypothetical protein [Sulfitobacter albidus]QUJ76928.1 hypothetical protein KDD17_02380 [Sulfitobacter albidus]
MLRVLFHIGIVASLTVLTQLGGVAWLIALLFQRRVLAFVLGYAALAVSAVFVAPLFGRVALSCLDEGPLEVHSWMYCALNRTYVAPELADALREAAEELARAYPGTRTQVLDANFPFFDGFALLRHLSHDDGEKADLAFYYRDAGGYLPGATRSPIGYFAFEQGPSDCPPVWPTLRWDMGAVQGLWRDLDLEPERTAAMLRILSDDPRIGKLFVEPHLAASLDVAHPKVRFQGCRAARHDDHIHLQLR